MPVVVVPEVGHLRQWAESPQPLRFACPLFPVVIGTDGSAAYRPRSQRVGIIYESFFRSMAANLVDEGSASRSSAS